MPKPERDEEREERITMEIGVDAYNSEERLTGWHCYFRDTLQFPFDATCISKRSMSPLTVKDKVEVIDLADPNDCTSEIFVLIRWEGDALAEPLSQLQPVPKTGEETRQAVADWHYWMAMGYEF